VTYILRTNINLNKKYNVSRRLNEIHKQHHKYNQSAISKIQCNKMIITNLNSNVLQCF
jgi:hypothetical protein